MKSVVVVGSITRNSGFLVGHVLDDLASIYDHVYISKSFCKCKLYPKNVIWVTGTGNIERRLKQMDNYSFPDHFDVCILPYHGQLVVHEIAALMKHNLSGFLQVGPNYNTRRVIVKTSLLDLFRPNEGSDPLIIN